jgi:hypothetical protein
MLTGRFLSVDDDPDGIARHAADVLDKVLVQTLGKRKLARKIADL